MIALGGLLIREKRKALLAVGKRGKRLQFLFLDAFLVYLSSWGVVCVVEAAFLVLELRQVGLLAGFGKGRVGGGGICCGEDIRCGGGYGLPWGI